MPRVAVVAAALVCALVLPARAEDCRYTIYKLDQFARDGRNERGAEQAAWCLRDVDDMAPRVIAACTRILDRDPEWATCWAFAAQRGVAALGKHDVFAWVAARPRGVGEVDPQQAGDPLALFAKLGDPRGAALVVATWTAAARRDAREQDRAWKRDYAAWRIHAAETLAGYGDAATAAFLVEQLRAAGDARVAKACRAAAEAIRAR
jgi:hypothetical protein